MLALYSYYELFHKAVVSCCSFLIGLCGLSQKVSVRVLDLFNILVLCLMGPTQISKMPRKSHSDRKHNLLMKPSCFFFCFLFFFFFFYLVLFCFVTYALNPFNRLLSAYGSIWSSLTSSLVQLTLVTWTSLISNNRLSRSGNLVLAKT